MRFRERIEAKVNVRLVARERGKVVPSKCREGHNTWVNFGRQYLPEVISPFDTGVGFDFTRHYNEPSVARVVKHMGFGIGGAEQTIDIATVYPTLAAHYPGQNTYTDSDVTVNYLQRPVKVSGTPGVGSAAGIWMNPLSYYVSYTGTPVHSVEYMAFFAESDINLSGYPAVPLSECGLMLSDEVIDRASNEVYDYGSGPAYIGAERQIVLAYNAFPPVSKTISVSFELYWEISF